MGAALSVLIMRQMQSPLIVGRLGGFFALGAFLAIKYLFSEKLSPKYLVE